MSEFSSDWTFFSNYAHVLVCLASDSHARLRDVADRVGITERTAVRLVTELEAAGILERVKKGRRNSYVINLNAPLRHSLESHCTVGALLTIILNEPAIQSKQNDAQAASTQALRSENSVI